MEATLLRMNANIFYLLKWLSSAARSRKLEETRVTNPRQYKTEEAASKTTLRWTMKECGDTVWIVDAKDWHLHNMSADSDSILHGYFFSPLKYLRIFLLSGVEIYWPIAFLSLRLLELLRHICCCNPAVVLWERRSSSRTDIYVCDCHLTTTISK